MDVGRIAVLSLGMVVGVTFCNFLQKDRISVRNLLAEPKYRPINPPVELLINPLTKPEHDTGEVTESVVSAYC